MARVLETRLGLTETLRELVGIKSGLALTKAQLVELLELNKQEIEKKVSILGGAINWWEGDERDVIRIRAENVEANLIYVMNSLGAIPDRRTSRDILADFIIREFGIDPKSDFMEFGATLGTALACLYIGTTYKQMLSTHSDASKILLIVDKFESTSEFDEFRRRNLLDRNLPIKKQWDGIIPLSALFESEEKPGHTLPEHFLDQRYIDYLHKQTEKVDKIHWRQFEYLTAEYFRRNGYIVGIGSGRADGGIDIAAKRDEGVIGPELIVVQCKRTSESNPVDIDTIKAFWTTMNEEQTNATKGLIVTTSRLVKGAKEFCEARKYRLATAERETVHL